MSYAESRDSGGVARAWLRRAADFLLRLAGEEGRALVPAGQYHADEAESLDAATRYIEACARNQQARYEAWAAADLAHRTEAYKQHIPSELQVVIAEVIKEKAKTEAETQYNVAKYITTINQQQATIAELRAAKVRAEAQAKPTIISCDMDVIRQHLATIEQLRERGKRLGRELYQTGLRLSALRKREGTIRAELRASVARLAAENARLRAELGRGVG